ncbi:hypothetical protein EVJ58_g10607 [Rhodofomes roseus]|uniref:Uncharacterized protein n=1 Tax=Rhodofomes roseus TaxID=34475 RepID=A0A4Y9XNN9_9APHY|nr:hypothetical protein EVJ58_g10607 [Rhodofomes roseus]
MAFSDRDRIVIEASALIPPLDTKLAEVLANNDPVELRSDVDHATAMAFIRKYRVDVMHTWLRINSEEGSDNYPALRLLHMRSELDRMESLAIALGHILHRLGGFGMVIHGHWHGIMPRRPAIQDGVCILMTLIARVYKRHEYWCNKIALQTDDYPPTLPALAIFELFDGESCHSRHGTSERDTQCVDHERWCYFLTVDALFVDPNTRLYHPRGLHEEELEEHWWHVCAHIDDILLERSAIIEKRLRHYEYYNTVVASGAPFVQALEDVLQLVYAMLDQPGIEFYMEPPTWLSIHLPHRNALPVSTTVLPVEDLELLLGHPQELAYWEYQLVSSTPLGLREPEIIALDPEASRAWTQRQILNCQRIVLRLQSEHATLCASHGRLKYGCQWLSMEEMYEAEAEVIARLEWFLAQIDHLSSEPL